MDFIINNYIWIIVISIILIMALIGYLAEKTDFIHETKKKKIEHNEEVKAKESEESIEAPKSEIPTVALESPIHEMDATTDALGFEDPFAMSSDEVADTFTHKNKAAKHKIIDLKYLSINKNSFTNYSINVLYHKKKP